MILQCQMPMPYHFAWDIWVNRYGNNIFVITYNGGLKQKYWGKVYVLLIMYKIIDITSCRKIYKQIIKLIIDENKI